LIGRDEDLAWLAASPGDTLVVGQPGSGKTALHSQFTMHRKRFFLATDDIDRIVAEIRRHDPDGIVIDDAHDRRELLRSLRHYRVEARLTFAIHAICWPGALDFVSKDLQVAAGNVRHLRLLTRDELVKVVNEIGIAGPDYLVQEIIEQSTGKPGLAVTLCHICLQDRVAPVRLADALKADLRTFLEPRLGPRVFSVLGAFALGGSRGESKERIAALLGISPIEVSEVASTCAAAGVVQEVGSSRIAIHPESLRHTLVRDTFFSGAGAISIEPFLAQLSGNASFVESLVGARSCGANISLDLLLALIEKTDSKAALAQLAWQGTRECEMARCRFPRLLMTFAQPSLHYCAADAVPGLLDAAVIDRRELRQHPDHPLRQIETWIEGAIPGSPEVIKRRRSLLRATTRWLASGGDRSTAIRSLGIALSPVFQTTRLLPGSGLSVESLRGTITPEETGELLVLWPEFINVFWSVADCDLQPIRCVLERWAYPGRAHPDAPADRKNTLHKVASAMVRDLVTLRPGDLCTLRWATEIAANLGFAVSEQCDPDFLTLFPIQSAIGDDMESWRKDATQAARSMASRIALMSPFDAITRLDTYAVAANKAGLTWPDLRSTVYAGIAELVSNPVSWVSAAIDIGSTEDLLHPFLVRLRDMGDMAWVHLAGRCIDDVRFRGTAVDVVLTGNDAPEQLVSRALQVAPEFSKYVEIQCMLRRFPMAVVRALLTHADCRVAGAAAVGEWGALPVHPRMKLELDWQDAVVRALREGYHLEAILQSQPILAVKWLRARIQEDDNKLGRSAGVLRAACTSLSQEQRAELIDVLPKSGHFVADLLRHLIGFDDDLYAKLLSNEELALFHLEPLAGHPNSKWIKLASMALSHGYSTLKVACAAFGAIQGWSGRESNMWEAWSTSFAVLKSHDDQDIRAVGEIGRKWAEDHAEGARKQEEFEDVFGRT
jgi:hypothetical protein